MAIEIAPEYLSPYVNQLPGASELAGILAESRGRLQFSRRLAAAGIDQIKRSQAQFAMWWDGVVDSLPPGVQEASLKIWDFATQLATAKTEEELRQAVQGMMLEIGYEALAAASAKVPIIGWIVGLGFAIADIIRIVLAEIKDEPDFVMGPSYDPDSDQSYVQQALDQLRFDDWTWLWLPRGTGDLISKRVAGNTEINRAWTLDGDDGWGAIPGSDRVWIAWYFNTDTTMEVNDRRLLPWAHGEIPQGVLSDPSYRGSWDDYRPQVRTMAGLLWERFQNPLNQFRVDMAAVLRAWQEFDQRLRDWPYSTKRSWWRAASVLTPPIRDDIGDRPEGAPDPCPAYNDPEVLDIPCALLRRVTWAYYRWRRRVFGLLGTGACAYVSRDWPSFRDPDLMDLLEVRRKQLLQHPSLRWIDVSAIPDADYRQAAGIRQSAMRPISGRPAPSTKPKPAADPPVLPDEPGVPPGGVGEPWVPFAPPRKSANPVPILLLLSMFM